MSARAIAAPAAGLIATAGWLVLGAPMVGAGLGAASAWGSPAAEAAFTLAIFGPILLIAVAGGRATGTRAVVAGRRPGAAMAHGGGVAFAALALATGYAALAGTLARGGGAGGWWVVPGMAVVAFQVLAEEALFRGWVQPALARAIGMPAAVAVTAAGFAALHMVGGAAGGIVLLNLMLGGLLFGALAARYGGIAGAFAAHWAWNAGEQLVLGLDPNPDAGAFGAVLDLDLVGAAAWGGSMDGLNGSVAMTAALLAVTVTPLWRLSGAGRAVPVDRVARPAEAR